MMPRGGDAAQAYDLSAPSVTVKSISMKSAFQSIRTPATQKSLESQLTRFSHVQSHYGVENPIT